MDYSFCHAVGGIDTDAAVFIYDICCQWSIHFRERVSRGRFLHLMEEFQMFTAVGKWHLGAHISECFYKFSLNFLDGSGQIDGEVMETIWSVLDKVSGLTRSMSKAHRQEILDDYINDGNWKKLIKSGTSGIYTLPDHI